MVYLGIDQHERHLTVTLRSEDGLATGSISTAPSKKSWTRTRRLFLSNTRLLSPTLPMNGSAANLASKPGWNSRVCGRIRNFGCVGINKTGVCASAEPTSPRRWPIA
jgi:hypothetical protein